MHLNTIQCCVRLFVVGLVECVAERQDATLVHSSLGLKLANESWRKPNVERACSVVNAGEANSTPALTRDLRPKSSVKALHLALSVLGKGGTRAERREVVSRCDVCMLCSLLRAAQQHTVEGRKRTTRTDEMPLHDTNSHSVISKNAMCKNQKSTVHIMSIRGVGVSCASCCDH